MISKHKQNKVDIFNSKEAHGLKTDTVALTLLGMKALSMKLHEIIRSDFEDMFKQSYTYSTANPIIPYEVSETEHSNARAITKLNEIFKIPGPVNRCTCGKSFQPRSLALRPCGHYLCLECMLYAIHSKLTQNFAATDVANTIHPTICDTCKVICEPAYWKLTDLCKHNSDDQVVGLCDGVPKCIKFDIFKFNWNEANVDLPPTQVNAVKELIELLTKAPENFSDYYHFANLLREKPIYCNVAVMEIMLKYDPQVFDSVKDAWKDGLTGKFK